jgi:alkanesulfonate monooxygenase SsuD/methylene tetrahydromethanopterin reductase-like flavin-dependent oxidoreductase (luciferase family)
MHMTYVSIHRDAAAARRVVKSGIVGAVSGSHPTYDFIPANGLEVPEALRAYLETGEREPARIMELIPDSWVAKLAIAGTVEDCTDQLQGLLDAGIQHPLLSPIPVEPGGELEILSSFTSEILPALRPVAAR